MISFRPAIQELSKLFGRTPADVASSAVDCWVEAPGTEVVVRPARVLPEALDRITGSMFGTVGEVVRDLLGGFTSMQGDTLGYRLRDVDLVDGVLYAGGTTRHLRRRNRRRSPAYRKPRMALSGAMYESWVGNRWFGMWLMDDCLTYRLAERHGIPVMTLTESGHVPHYERRLDFRPRRVSDAHFDELILFNDMSHNENKRARASDYRRRLIGDRHVERHPGVFLLRGYTGDRRVLRNERAIADRLMATRGYRILDPSTASIDEIVRDCAGADVVAGIEGSQLAHGMMVMKPAACLFTIQPQGRVVSAMKMTTDRQEQDFALVVGHGEDGDFIADWEEVERTLDLLP